MKTLRTRFLTPILGLAAMGATASAQVVYVDANLATGANDGSSWSNAFQGVEGLQNALAVVVAGEQVYVADGLYKPTSGTSRTLSIRAQNDVEIYGGFLGGESSPAERPPFDTAPSILSGDLLDNDGSGAFTDNSFHVLRINNTNQSAIVDGFRIQGGNANQSGSNRDRGGGILAINNANGIVRNCRFLDNRCTFGGGAGYVNGAPSFLNCSFEDNVGGSFGGAFDIAGSGAVLFDGCYFEGNRASRAGALEIFATNGSRVLNCVFFDNLSTGSGGGGGLWIGSGSNTQIRNCTIVANVANNQAQGGIAVSSANPTIANCVLWNNTGNGNMNPVNQVNLSADVTYCLVQGGFSGTGNIGGDPMFVDQAGGDYRLGLTSPAIDAGNNAGVPAGFLSDFDGNPRFVDVASVPDTGGGTAPIVDMGAFEVQSGIGMGDPGCSPLPNSTGLASSLSASGSLALAMNSLDLSVVQLPMNQFSYFVMSQNTASTPVASGVLCLGAPQIRFTSFVLNSGTAGAVTFSPDLQNLPQGQVFQSGETWWFQLWHRDNGGTSNFSNNLGFTWQ